MQNRLFSTHTSPLVAFFGRNRRIGLILAAFVLVSISACTTSISFNGTSVSENLKTFTVEQFENDARVVVPGLAQDFSLELTDIFLRNTRLANVKSNGDLIFTGAITQYDVTPVAIQGNETAAQNRLTVSVKVFCENTQNDEDSWDSSFSQFTDFDATTSLADVEEELIADISEKLTQDIFNKTFSNW